MTKNIPWNQRSVWVLNLGVRTYKSFCADNKIVIVWREGIEIVSRNVFWPSDEQCKVPALARGRLLAILLTGGEADDCPAEWLIATASQRFGDKGDESAELRRGLKEIAEPGQSFRTAATEGSHSASASAFTGNDENAFGRLKDLRRIGTRHDRLGCNFLASVCIVAALVWRT